MKRAFTLIEALTVIAVIGILASLVTVSVNRGQQYARDAKRKSDLTAIAFGFKARFEDRTCPQAIYPGSSDTRAFEGWMSVADLYNANDGSFCDVFSNYLRNLPSEPRFNDTYPYVFNLSDNPKAKHFRLTTRLERPRQTVEELERLSKTWQEFFSGKAYPLATPLNDGYNYFIGD